MDGGLFVVAVVAALVLAQLASTFKLGRRAPELEGGEDGTVWSEERRVDGVDVALRVWQEVYDGTASTWSAVHATVPGPVPPGLRLGRQRVPTGLSNIFGPDDLQIRDPLLDRQLAIHCEVPSAARWMLRDVHVAGSLAMLLDGPMDVTVEGRSVRLRFAGDDRTALNALAEEAAGLAGHLAEAYAAPLRALAEGGLELALDEHGARLSGQLDGREVGVRLGAGEHEAEVVVHTARLPGGLEARKGSGGLRLPDPVLDSALEVTVDPDGEEAALALLGAEGVRGPLLEVLHGHPGSELAGDRVVLRAGDLEPDALQRLVDVAVELAEALNAAPCVRAPDPLGHGSGTG